MITDPNISTALSPSQKQVLLAPVSHPDARIWPLPNTLTVKGGALQRVLLALLKANLVAEVAAKDADQVWRLSEAGQPLTLRATDAAWSALGLQVPEPIEPVKQHTSDPRGKLGQVLIALESETGVTLDALVTLTGWLPHTARAALTRLRQRGHAIVRERVGASSTYRIETRSDVGNAEHPHHAQ
jgi:hypothetical protein